MLPQVFLAAILAATPQGAAHPEAIIGGAPRALAVSGPTVTPASISFTATNPDNAATVTGSASAVLRFSIAATSNWSVAVSAPASFTNCSTVPVTAVTATATCTTTVGTSNCTSGALSTGGTTIATGRHTGSGADAYTITIAFTLADSWAYIASAACSLAVTYSITG